MADRLDLITWQLAAAHLSGDHDGVDLILDSLDTVQLRDLVAAQAAALAALLVATATGAPAGAALTDHPTAADALLAGLRGVLAEHALDQPNPPPETE